MAIILMRKASDRDIICSCMLFFGLPTVSELIDQRKVRFLFKCNLLDNLLCKVCQLL